MNFRGIGFRISLEDAALRFARLRQRHRIFSFGSVQQPGDDAVVALVDRRGRRLAAHRAVDGFDRKLGGVRGRVRFPRRNLALARLARGDRDVNDVVHGLVEDLGRQPQHRADAGHHAGGDVREVVDAVLVQANALRQAHIDLVRSRNAANEVLSIGPALLADRDDCRDHVAGMVHVDGEKRVVEIELPDC